jgi:hypothetical protein
VSVARQMEPAANVFARVMGPPNRQGHGARVAGDRILDRQGHGTSRSPGEPLITMLWNGRSQCPGIGDHDALERARLTITIRSASSVLLRTPVGSRQCPI